MSWQDVVTPIAPVDVKPANVEPGFTQLTADHLGEAITQRDGFDAQMLTTSADLSAAFESIDDFFDGYSELVMASVDLPDDPDPELPHAIDAQDAELKRVNDAYLAEIGPNPPGIAALTPITPPDVGDDLGQIGTGLRGLQGDTIIITQPGGGPGEIVHPPETPRFPKRGANGYISIARDTTVDWTYPFTLSRAVEVWVINAGGTEALFAQGNSGSQTAAWVTVPGQSYTFSLRGDGTEVDSVSVAASDFPLTLAGQ